MATMPNGMTTGGGEVQEWPEDDGGTALHLDADEWSGILHCLKSERNQCAAEQKADNDSYLGWLDNIILKVEIALGRR